MKLPNRYASPAEQLLACTKLPSALKNRLQAKDNLQALVAPLIALPEQSYHVTYHDGVLVLSTSHTSLVGHLRYLQHGLLTNLQSLPQFHALHSIKVVLRGK